MITGHMTSHRDDTNARIWTLTVPEAPRPGQLIEWDEPACGSIPAREGVRGWVIDAESTKPGTVVMQVATEGTRWVIVNVDTAAEAAEVQAPADDPAELGAPAPAAVIAASIASGTPVIVTDDQAPAVDLFSAEWPYPQLSAADFAAIYTAAAGHIEARGYYAHEVQGYADDPGLSVTGALKLAALEYITAADPAAPHGHQLISAQELTEELETRLSAVLYVYGQAHNRTRINDFSDIHVGWALGHFASAASTSAAGRRGHGMPTREHALTLLRKTAAMFTMIADDTAPVTEAPAPARF